MRVTSERDIPLKTPTGNGPTAYKALFETTTRRERASWGAPAPLKAAYRASDLFWEDSRCGVPTSRPVCLEGVSQRNSQRVGLTPA